MIRASVLLLCAALGSHAEPLADTIEKIIAGSPALNGANIGIRVVQLATGKALVDRSASDLFVPASNTKLFSTSLALTRLGPDYRFTTRVLAATAAANGRIAGDLVLAGGGDPTMSNRKLPYDRDPALADAMQPIEQLADQVFAAGVRTIAGDIVGDDSAYIWEPYPPGWAADDTIWEYGSPVSALPFNHNCVVLNINGGARAGDAAILSPSPALEYYAFNNLIRTVEKGETKIAVERAPGAREITIRGTVAPGVEVFPQWLAVDDPPLYAATALYDALLRRGVAVQGRPVSRHRWPGEPERPLPPVQLAERKSPPLLEILQVTDKISSNLWAEIVLREIARNKVGVGSREAGLKELAAFLQEVGITPKDYALYDASGLSRLGLVKPAAVTRLLEYMRQSRYSDQWTSLLPIGGYDGTLMNRFPGEAEAARLHAKTGSLTHVAALSGYVSSASHGDLAFSILVNNYNAPASEVRQAIDKIGLALVR